MALQRPYVTNRFIAHAGDRLTTTLSLAVAVFDEFTLEMPATGIEVVIEEGRNKRVAVRNRSGYFCFNNLLPQTYTVAVRPDPAAGNWFVAQTRQIIVPRPNHLHPVEEFILKTTPAYPFPAHANLIRGMVVVDPQAVPLVPVIGAAVTAAAEFLDPNQPPATVTDQNGEFALFLRDVELEDDEPFVKDITLTIAKGGQQKPVPITDMKEGTTVNLQRIKFP